MRHAVVQNLPADSFELVVIREVNHNLAAALGRLADLNFRPERRFELLLERPQLAALGSPFMADRVRLSVGIDDRERLDSACSIVSPINCSTARTLSSSRTNPLAEIDLLLLITQRQQRPRVPRGYRSAG